MKFITTALPLPATVMVEFFKDKKGHEFVVDYEQSLVNLKTPQAILNYIANLKLVCSFNFERVPSDLLSAYMNMRDVVQCTQLIKAHANVLYYAKYQTPLFTESLATFGVDDIVAFINDNQNDVLIQLAFLNSLPLYVVTTVNATADDDGSEHELVRIIDDNVYKCISVNLFNLFTLETFLIQFLSYQIPTEHQIYFTEHFNSNMYGGLTLFGHFAHPKNSYFNLCQYVIGNMASGVGRAKLFRAHRELLELNNDVDGMQALYEDVMSSGSVPSFLNLTNRDVAELNRMTRREKKRAKRAMNVHT